METTELKQKERFNRQEGKIDSGTADVSNLDLTRVGKEVNRTTNTNQFGANMTSAEKCQNK